MSARSARRDVTLPPGGEAPAHHPPDQVVGGTRHLSVRPTLTLTAPRLVAPTSAVLSPRRFLGQLMLAMLAVMIIAGGAGALASARFAQQDAVRDSAHTADLLASAVVTPALADDIVAGTTNQESFRALDLAVRRSVLPHGIVRVKLWTPQGRIVYSDELRLVGKTYPLEADKIESLHSGRTGSVISNLTDRENDFERQTNRKLLESYRPVYTPGGHKLLFEVYGDYAPVRERYRSVLEICLALLVTTLALFLALFSPVLGRLFRRLNVTVQQRESLLQRAIDAGDIERKRISATLHDGPVQELVASSLVVEQAARRAAREDKPVLAADIRGAAASLRGSVASLRSLLVDIYPSNLEASGLEGALEDLAAPLRGRGVSVLLDIPEEIADSLTSCERKFLYRVSQELLRDAAKHARAGVVRVRLSRGHSDAVILTVDDDGVGFDPVATVAHPSPGHLGIPLMMDLATEAGAGLSVSSAPSAGTQWTVRLAVSTPGLTESRSLAPSRSTGNPGPCS